MTVADNEFYQAVGRIEGKMDTIVRSLPLLESRVRALENWRWMLVGAACVIGSAVGVAVSVLMP